jgi:Flp pilus assembly pilin Flp
MRQKLVEFSRCDRGATALEYAFIAAFIALAIVGVLPLVGGTLRDRFQAVVDSFGSS